MFMLGPKIRGKFRVRRLRSQRDSPDEPELALIVLFLCPLQRIGSDEVAAT
jgi:hypothetical protein